MNNKSLDKMIKIVSKGKKNYIFKYGVLGWGIPTGIIVVLFDYIRERPVIIREFILLSSITIIIFALMGTLWGTIMFTFIRKKILKEESKNQK